MKLTWEKVALIKELENKYALMHSNQDSICVRLDGCKFSKFTRQFQKPFDLQIVNAMRNTARDLMDAFGAKWAYTISDEITLLIEPPLPPELDEQDQDEEDQIENEKKMKKKKKKTHPSTTYLHRSGGRNAKLTSVTAAYASARFNFHLSEFHQKSHQDEPRRLFCATFDSRCFSMKPSFVHQLEHDLLSNTHQEQSEQDENVKIEPTIADIIYWRQTLDGRRNVVGIVGRDVMGHDHLQNWSTLQTERALRDRGLLIYEPDFNMIDITGRNCDEPVTLRSPAAVSTRSESKLDENGNSGNAVHLTRDKHDLMQELENDGWVDFEDVQAVWLPYEMPSPEENGDLKKSFLLLHPSFSWGTLLTKRKYVKTFEPPHRRNSERETQDETAEQDIIEEVKEPNDRKVVHKSIVTTRKKVRVFYGKIRFSGRPVANYAPPDEQAYYDMDSTAIKALEANYNGK